MPDTSIVPTGFTVASPACQYVIGRDNGTSNHASVDGGVTQYLRLLPPYPNSDAAKVLFLAQVTSPGRVGFEASEGFGYHATDPIVCNFGVTVATLSSLPTAGNLGLYGSFVFGLDDARRKLGRYGAYGNPGDPNPPPPFYDNDWRYLDVAGFNWKAAFSVPVRGFGFYAIDLGDFEGVLRLKMYYSDATTEEVDMPYTLGGSTGQAPWNGSVTYVGLIFTKDVDRIDFLNSSGGVDNFGFDEFTAAVSSQVTPPPTGPPPVVPRAPSDCVPFFIAGPCPQECPVEVPEQVITPIPPGGPTTPTVPPVAAPQYVWYCYQWFDGFSGSFVYPGVPGIPSDCGPAFSVPAVVEQCA